MSAAAVNVITMRVHELKDETVIMNPNYPLAGEVLVFDLRILAVGEQKEERHRT